MFWKRLASGIVLLVIAIAGIALGGYVLAGLLLLISLIAYTELTKVLAGEEKYRPSAPDVIGLCAVASYYVLTVLSYHPAGAEGEAVLSQLGYWAVLTAVFVLAELFAYVLKFPAYDADRIAGAVFSFFYAPVMLSFLYLLRELPGRSFLVWLVLISSWGCDTCAYCVGKLIGKRKIFPVLSPHKSLEGCIGGVLGAALIAFLYGVFYVNRVLGETGMTVPLLIALVAAVGAVMSMVGDLAASAIKRNKNIKDYGRLIPGHGGIMDRFDSVIVTAPATFLLVVLLI